VSETSDGLAVGGGRLRLIAQHHSARQPAREFTQPVTILGSDDACDFILASKRVDAAHAGIVRLGGSAYACDLGAPGGTYVNGRPIRWCRLGSGDEVQVGPFRFKVDLAQTGAVANTAPPMFSLRSDATIGTVVSDDPVLLVGSSPACDVILRGDAVSPRHALVVWSDEGPIVRSLCGTVRQNGQSITCGVLQPGDAVGVGPYELIFETADIEIETAALIGETATDAAATGIAAAATKHEPLLAGRLSAAEVPTLDALWTRAHARAATRADERVPAGATSGHDGPANVASFDFGVPGGFEADDDAMGLADAADDDADQIDRDLMLELPNDEYPGAPGLEPETIRPARCGRIDERRFGVSSGVPRDDIVRRGLHVETDGQTEGAGESAADEGAPVAAAPGDSAIRADVDHLKAARRSAPLNDAERRVMDALIRVGEELDSRAESMRERVGMAQQALDRRADKLRVELESERKELLSREAELRSKISELAYASEHSRQEAARLVDLHRQREALRARETELQKKAAEMTEAAAAKRRELEALAAEQKAVIEEEWRKLAALREQHLAEAKAAKSATPAESPAEATQTADGTHVEQGPHAPAESTAARSDTSRPESGGTLSLAQRAARLAELVQAASYVHALSRVGAAIEAEVHSRQSQLDSGFQFLSSGNGDPGAFSSTGLDAGSMAAESLGLGPEEVEVLANLVPRQHQPGAASGISVDVLRRELAKLQGQIAEMRTSSCGQVDAPAARLRPRKLQLRVGNRTTGSRLARLKDELALLRKGLDETGPRTNAPRPGRPGRA